MRIWTVVRQGGQKNLMNSEKSLYIDDIICGNTDGVEVKKFVNSNYQYLSRFCCTNGISISKNWEDDNMDNAQGML